MESSFSNQIKDVFFNHRGRFSRETFAITFAGLLLFIFISSPLLYKLCGLFLPWLIIVLLALAYVGYMIYAMFVLCIKRLHDLNMSGWASILVMIPLLNILLVAYLCLTKGDSGNNRYGEALDYKGPSFLLFLSYAVLCFYALATGVGLYYGKKLRNIQNTGQGVQKMIGILPKAVREELKQNPRAMGVLFVDNQFTAPAVSITENRILIRGIEFKTIIQQALLKGKKVEVRFSDNSFANVTKLVVSDDSLSVQMAVFEIDQPIGVPAKLGDRNRQLLEKMNAF